MTYLRTDTGGVQFLILEPSDLDTLRAGEMLTQSLACVNGAERFFAIAYSEHLAEIMPRFKRGELTTEQLIEGL